MQLSHLQLSALIAAVIRIAHSHVIMESPVPYGADHIDSNPLLADGSDFPCKQRDNVYKLIKQNIMPVGQTQTLSFRGQATHGGGACQISLTTDKQPTKNSVWKVIHSIEGGCPSTHPGNLGDNPEGFGADKFQFAIPAQVPTGDYTLAWTWFNKIGNREMYMNCAPITVTGASQKRTRRYHKAPVHGHLHSNEATIHQRADALSSLPDMFIANIGNGCATTQGDGSGGVVAIPQQNLGTNVQRIGADKLFPPQGDCRGSQVAAAAAAAPVSTSSPSPVPSRAASAPPAPVPSTPAAPAPQPASSAPALPQISAIPPAASPAPAAAPLPNGVVSSTCSTPGKSLCSPDGTGIGTCDEQGRVIFVPAPMGTKCDATLGVLVQAKPQGFKA